jgi:hypothetical protein
LFFDYGCDHSFLIHVVVEFFIMVYMNAIKLFVSTTGKTPSPGTVQDAIVEPPQFLLCQTMGV